MTEMNLLKLKKDDIKQLDKAGYDKSYFGKGDMLVCDINENDFKGILAYLGTDGGAAITVVKPIDKDNLKFALLDDLSLDLPKGTEEFVDKICDQLQEAAVRIKYGIKDEKALRICKSKNVDNVNFEKISVDDTVCDRKDDSVYDPKNIEIKTDRLEVRDVANIIDKIRDDVVNYIEKLAKVQKLSKTIDKTVSKSINKEIKHQHGKRDLSNYPFVDLRDTPSNTQEVDGYDMEDIEEIDSEENREENEEMAESINEAKGVVFGSVSRDDDDEKEVADDDERDEDEEDLEPEIDDYGM